MTRRRGPVIANRRTATILGVLLLAGAYACFWDAYNARGGQSPAILRPVLPF